MAESLTEEPVQSAAFGDFPNEVILNVLDFLDRDGLHNMLDVSKRFRELIILNRKLMRRMPLTLNKNWIKKIEFASDFGDCVTDLNMDFCTFDSFEEFQSILDIFCGIEQLKLNYIYIKQPAEEMVVSRPPNDNEIVPATFPFLQSLDLSSKFWGYITKIDSKILKYLNTENLTELRIKFPMQKFSPDFIEFLCKQRRLKTLEVFDEFIDSFLFDDFTENLTNNSFISSLFEIDLSEKATFQLKRFAIHYRGDHHENFTKFLNSQNELDDLEIRKYDDSFIRFKLNFDLLRNFRVRKLSLPFELIPPLHTLTNVDTCINPGVKELSLTGLNNDQNVFNLMIKLFPNVKVLQLEYMLEFQCESLSQLPHLETIIAGHFKIEALAHVKIPKLKRLEIKNVYPFVYTDWENITKVNANIEEIVIHEISHYNTMTAIKNSVALMMRDLNQLKYLKITQNQSPDCLKIVADMRSRILRLSPFAMKMCRDIFNTDLPTTSPNRRFDTINYIF